MVSIANIWRILNNCHLAYWQSKGVPQELCLPCIPTVKGPMRECWSWEKGQSPVSQGKKINVCSSTNGELLGANDDLPHALWSQYFMEIQGYAVEKCIMFQDNMSGILLEKDGNAASSKHTKHIHVRYFLSRTKGEIKVEYCPTEQI